MAIIQLFTETLTVKNTDEIPADLADDADVYAVDWKKDAKTVMLGHPVKHQPLTKGQSLLLRLYWIQHIHQWLMHEEPIWSSIWW